MDKGKALTDVSVLLLEIMKCHCLRILQARLIIGKLAGFIDLERSLIFIPLYIWIALMLECFILLNTKRADIMKKHRLKPYVNCLNLTPFHIKRWFK
jgi:hypothetical protein